MSKVLLDHYKKQALSDYVEETSHERVRAQWLRNSYNFNHCITLPLYIAEVLGTSDTVQQRMVTEIIGYISNFGIKDFVESINLEIEPDIRGTGFLVELVVSEPGVGYRQKARQVFQYNLQPMEESKRSIIANRIMDTFKHRNRYINNNAPVKWLYGSTYNIHSHIPEEEDALHVTLCMLLKDNCKISLQRHPLSLRSRNSNSEFYQYHGEVQCWSLHRKQ